MKQKDIAIIVAVIGGSALLSFIVFNFVFGNKTNEKISVEVIEPISAEFSLPNETYFNSNSLNPTQTITISPDQNQNPFNR